MTDGLSSAGHVVIVGASLAGVRTAQALRLKKFGGAVTLIGAESESPYDRPPLSKTYLAAGAAKATPLLSDSALTDLDLDLRTGRRAIGVDADSRIVSLDDGTQVGYDVLVAATGARARSLNPPPEVEGFLSLRTLADAERLSAEFNLLPRVAVVGGGFIGSEVAAAARNRGLDVTMIEALPAPMSRVLGDGIGGLLADLHRRRGVDVRCGVSVVGVDGAAGRVTQLTLSDDTTVAADLVVVGIGVAPETEWLAGAGLDLADGVLCDGQLHAVGRHDIYAAGDVARWHHPVLDRVVRVEHWTNAQEHAMVVAGAILGEDGAADALPYVWSDQHQHRIQIIGHPTPGDRVTLIEDSIDGRHVAVYSRTGPVSAVLSIDAPKTMMKGRRAIVAGTSVTEFVAQLG